MNTRVSKKNIPIAAQSSEDLLANVIPYDNPVGTPPASPQQFDDNADAAQPDLEPADLATAAIEPSPTPGPAAQPVQVPLQPRSPLIGPAIISAVAVAEGVVALPSPQQLGDDADSAQPGPRPADHATAAVGLPPTPGLASQPVQVILQPRSPPISPDVVTVVATAKDVVDEIDIDAEAGPPDEGDM
ncbi:hypothetical protein K457DRAFT_139498 [Linnemannia elongata AG-77]|uniref:Uncharacterized protein n=1 Tax=Linnemannia elongata AG-77 TaxID=1314771 RepID=A0A197JRI6_9FUNG|nr:hypothetical protein K457DRAFT_139498 [Linnemannia elongata AG-77]